MKREWYTSPSHAKISGDALNLGPLLFYLADPNWDKNGDDATPLIDVGFGEPLTIEDIAKEARWPVRRVRSALGELVTVGTLEFTDGRYVIPNFGRHQQDPSAKRKRSGNSPGKSRGNSGGKSADDDENVPSSSSSLSPPEMRIRIIEELSATVAVALTQDAHVVVDACRAVDSKRYRLEDLAKIIRAAQAGQIPGVLDPLRVFQVQHTEAVRKHVFGDSRKRYTC